MGELAALAPVDIGVPSIRAQALPAGWRKSLTLPDNGQDAVAAHTHEDLNIFLAAGAIPLAVVLAGGHAHHGVPLVVVRCRVVSLKCADDLQVVALQSKAIGKKSRYVSLGGQSFGANLLGRFNKSLLLFMRWGTQRTSPQAQRVDAFTSDDRSESKVYTVLLRVENPRVCFAAPRPSSTASTRRTSSLSAPSSAARVRDRARAAVEGGVCVALRDDTREGISGGHDAAWWGPAWIGGGRWG